MSDPALIRWMARIDERLAALQASVVECQGRCRADTAVRKAESRPRARLVRALTLIATAAAGALAAHFAGR